MRYADFRKLVQDYPFFRSNIFEHLTDKVPLLRDQLGGWVKSGYVLQLKRGMYALNNNDRKAALSEYFLANNLYMPSYVSLESALSFYNFIPERVHAVTSVTTKKTQRFENVFGVFVYYHIRPGLFGDFHTLVDEGGNGYFMAMPERALVDFLYFKTRGLAKVNKDIFAESFRLQNLDIVRCEKLAKIAGRFENKKLLKTIAMLIDFIRN